VRTSMADFGAAYAQSLRRAFLRVSTGAFRMEPVRSVDTPDVGRKPEVCGAHSK